MAKIVVIGSTNTDLVIKTERIPEQGETVIGGSFMMTAGGKGANQAVAAARMDGDVIFVTKVGDDMFGEESQRHFADENLPSEYIFTEHGSPSGVALITVDARGENCIVVAPGANDTLSRSDIDAVRSQIEAADFLLLQLEIPMEVVEYATDIAHRAGTKVILNPAPAAQLSRELIGKLYLITPNRTECQLLTGRSINDEKSAEAAATVLLAMGARNVIITLGSRGALVAESGGEHELIPAQHVVAVDTTAAGDVFNGALCVALSEGRTLSEAATFATKASAISVTRMGAQSSIPYRIEIK